MSAWRDLLDLLEMYYVGGAVIMTGIDGELMETAVSPPASSYIGKSYTHAGIRTVIQFDSDYVTTLSPAVLQQPEIWQKHVAHINTKLAVLDKLYFLAQKSWLLFLLIPLVWSWYGYDLSSISSWRDGWRLIYPTISGIIIILARKWILRFLQLTILPLITRVIGWFVQHKFKQFLGNMQ